MRSNHRPGTREWYRQFEEDRRRGELVLRWCWVGGIVGAIATIVLVATGYLPLWVLFI